MKKRKQRCDSPYSSDRLFKKCTRCLVVLSVTAYRPLKQGAWEGFRSFCRKCDYERQEKCLKKKKAKIIDLLGGRCVDCGIADHRVLGFHHFNEDGYKDRHESKRDEGGTRRYRYYNLLLTRIKDRPGDLVLLCSNCHIIRHAIKREGHGRLMEELDECPGSKF